MIRRTFLKSLTAGAGAGLAGYSRAEAALPKAKITRVRIYEPPNLNRLFNQSNMLATVETDIGITGVGEGGAKDTLEQCAGSLIGKNPFRIEQIWQEMFMAWFYPPGREKTHALGALDLALWDIKGKALKAPLHEILGGAVRDYCDCYATGGVRPQGAAGARVTLGDRARATMEAGYRVFRMGAGDTPEGRPYDTRERVRQMALDCAEVRKAIGPNGEWMIDFHQRFEYSDALRGCKMLEQYDPFLVEDPVRDEHALEDLPKLRAMTSVPLAFGEEWGHRWEFNKLVENHDIDYLRATIPNVGGITEWLKVSAMCETHAVGIIPHFTGPVATAALVNCLATFPGTVLFEYNYGDQPIPYLPEFLDFKKGKLYTNDRPGLGVTLEMKPLKLIGEVTQPGRRSLYFRPDGSPTHW
jgi:L-alanine-DL-glutamate epimerase-like enolase superfamily enzyme